MNRANWKAYWRLMRILRRETSKAMDDMVIFGTGCVEIGPEVKDFIRHIPIEDVKPRGKFHHG